MYKINLYISIYINLVFVIFKQNICLQLAILIVLYVILSYAHAIYLMYFLISILIELILYSLYLLKTLILLYKNNF